MKCFNFAEIRTGCDRKSKKLTTVDEIMYKKKQTVIKIKFSRPFVFARFLGVRDYPPHLCSNTHSHTLTSTLAHTHTHTPTPTHPHPHAHTHYTHPCPFSFFFPFVSSRIRINPEPIKKFLLFLSQDLSLSLKLFWVG